ncbi:MAG: FAD:protein FMN transferase, partial [Bdellovibrionia bacterium]
MTKTIFFIACLFAVSAEAIDDLKRFDFMQKHMGTAFRITVYSESAEAAKKATDLAFERIAAVDRALSDYSQTSELAALQKAPALEWIDISPIFARAVKASIEISERTGGLFDISVGTLSRLWRKTRETKQLPSRSTLAVARSNAGYKLIEFKSNKLRFKKAGVQLDFGGIGKGIAVDEAFESLVRSGLKHILV